MSVDPGQVADRLYLEVVGDTKGLAGQLKKDIAAQTAALKIKIKAEVDSKGLKAQVKAAAAEASKAAKVKLKVELDTRGLKTEVVALAKALSAAATVKLQAQLNSKGLKAQAVGAAKAASGATVKMNTSVNSKGAQQQLAGLTKPRTARVNAKLTGVSTIARALKSFSILPAIVGGLTAAVSLVGNLAGGLVAVAAAASQALGVLAAIPAALGAAVQVLGTLLAGFSGIGAALKAMTSAQAASGREAAASAKARLAAERRVGDAQRAVARARKTADRQARDDAEAIAQARENIAAVQEQSARRIRDAQRAVSDGERRVTDSQTASLRAQKDLNQAREDAQQKLNDYRLELSGAALDEEAAALAVEKSTKRLKEVLASPDSSSMDRREADLDYRQSVQRLEEIKSKNAELRKEADKAQKAGVEGDDKVVEASQKVADAKQEELDAAQNLADQQQDLADAQADNLRDQAKAQKELDNAIRDSTENQLDSQERIQDALQNLSEAQADAATAADKTSASESALAAAMANLSPAAQRFVRYLKSTFMPAWKDAKFAVQEALFPPLQEAVQRSLPLLDTLKVGMVGTAKTIGNTAKQIAGDLASSAGRADIATIMASNNRAVASFAGAFRNLVSVFKDLAVAGGPVLEDLATYIERVTGDLKDMTAEGRKTGSLADFFKRSEDRAAQLWRILVNIGGAIGGVFKAGSETGGDFLDILERVTKRWDDWTHSIKGQNEMKDFFEKTKPIVLAVFNLLGDVLELFFNLSKGGAGGGLVGVVNGIDSIVQSMNDWLQNPDHAELANTIATIAGAAGGLGIVAGFLLTIVSRVGKAFSLFKGLGTILRGFLALFGIGEAAAGAAGAGAAAGGGGAAAGGGALAALGGPIGLIIAGIIALGVLLVIAYKKVKWFHDGVNRLFSAIGDGAVSFYKNAILPAFHGIQEAADFLWTNALKPVFEEMQHYWTDVIAPALLWLWHNIFEPTFEGIGAAITAVWRVAGPYLTAIARLVKGVFAVAFKVAGLLIEGVIKGIILPQLMALSFVLRKVVGPVVAWLWRKIIGPYFKAIGEAIANVWHYVIRPVFEAITDQINGIADIFDWLSKNVPSSWGGMGKALKAGWDWMVRNIFRPVQHALEDVAKWFGNMKDKAVRAWSDFYNGVKSWWEKTVRDVFQKIKDMVEAVKGWFGGLPKRIGEIFTDLYNRVKSGWSNIVSNVLAGIKKDLDTVKGWFSAAVTGIGKLWDGLRAGLSGPLQWVVDTVYNNGIRKVWNTVAHLVHLPELPAIGASKPQTKNNGKGQHSGPVNVGGGHMALAKGGVIPGYAPGRDTETVLMSRGEGVLVPEAVRGIARSLGTSAGRAIDAINSTFSSRVPGPGLAGGMPAFAGGGVLSWLGRRAKDVAGLIPSGLDALGSAAKNITIGALKDTASAAFAPLRDLMARVLPSNIPWPNLLRGAINQLLGGALDLFGSRDSAAANSANLGPASGPVSTAGARSLGKQMAEAFGWSGAQWAALERLWTGESGWNPNAKNPTSTAFGIPQFLKSTAAAYGLRYGDTDAGHQIAAGLRYIKDAYGSPANAFAKWSARSPHWYDQGGQLPPGLSTVMNGTGVPEAVLTQGQFQALAGAASHNAEVPALLRRLLEVLSDPRSRAQIAVYPRANQSEEQIARDVDFRLAWSVV